MLFKALYDNFRKWSFASLMWQWLSRRKIVLASFYDMKIIIYFILVKTVSYRFPAVLLQIRLCNIDCFSSVVMMDSILEFELVVFIATATIFSILYSIWLFQILHIWPLTQRDKIQEKVTRERQLYVNVVLLSFSTYILIYNNIYTYIYIY